MCAVNWMRKFMEERHTSTAFPLTESEELSRFTESYASFSRVVNSLQRQYIALKDEFAAQNRQLAETNRKLVEANQQNLSATTFLHNILNAITAGVIAVDTNGRITHFNPAAELLLGIRARDVLGKAYREAIPPGEPTEANALRAAESRQDSAGVEKVWELTDGTRLQVSVSTAILYDDDRQPTGAIEVFHDLTKMKQMEQELARLNTLAALGEMAATIAHEVRNPLTGISGFAAFLKRDLAPDDPRQKLVAKIARGVDSLNQTVTSLLNYTRFEEVNTEPTDYPEFLRHTVEQFRYDQPELARGVKIDVRSHYGDAGSPLMVVCDPMLLRQLFFNIFKNAIEAGPEQPQVSIRFRKLPRQAATRQYGSRLMLSLDQTIVETIIADNGPGLSDEARDKLFAPFFTTKPGGNGLGLAMAWKIVKAHGGDVFADNDPKGGAVFTLLLPTRIDAAAPSDWSNEA
ncbi:PAS domain-containing protein [candidate division GN15 bacterium]|nr:PAS domain-containing protein [candidate division GN15 bacterium]